LLFGCFWCWGLNPGHAKHAFGPWVTPQLLELVFMCGTG
jgi:hypothetical protein